MTIKRRVRVALSLMMLIPVFLMIGAFGVARRFTTDTNQSGPFGRARLLNARERIFLAEFNRLVNDDPRSLSDPRTLAALDRMFGREPFGGWVILRDGQEIYRSSDSSTVGRAYGGWGRRWHDRESAPDLSWSFRFGDGSAGTLLLYSGMPWSPPFRSPGWFAAFLAVLLGCNGLLGWWISSSVIAPLARLRRAAIRIGDGGLDFRLAPGGPDEFGEVTAAFETMREKLQAAVTRQLAEETSRKELVAHVSHDLRTPINLIRGYAEGLRDGVASNPQMRTRYLETILQRAGELEKLIELLFAYSTMDLEGVRPKLTAVDVGPYFQDLRDSLAAAFPSASISLELPEKPEDRLQHPGSLRIMADVDLTRRVMSNLVDNAVKHGGKQVIAVEWRVARATTGEGAAVAVEVVVSDDGAGVAAEDLPRIFEPFFRADRARTRGHHGSGAGLGLSIVSRIMQAQGGSVRAAPGPAGGLQVTLVFLEAENSVEADPDP
ncbi:MAG: HAMP domain-containing sensor histidine kinase [Spirochaetia bacterium]